VWWLPTIIAATWEAELELRFKDSPGKKKLAETLSQMQACNPSYEGGLGKDSPRQKMVDPI
jgi:hypothetical protein